VDATQGIGDLSLSPSTTQVPQHHASRGGARVHRSPGGI